jgi:hypothetical protein
MPGSLNCKTIAPVELMCAFRKLFNLFYEIDNVKFKHKGSVYVKCDLITPMNLSRSQYLHNGKTNPKQTDCKQ